MKRTANRTITSYFAKRPNREATVNESDGASSTAGAVATTTVDEEDSANVMTTEDNDTGSISAVVTPLNPSICVVQAQEGVRPVDTDSAVSDLGTLVDGPSQPNLGSYPRGQKNRCFRATWYTSYPWLEYSIAKDKAFCFACRNFITSTSKSDTAFTKVGFSTWSKAMENNRGFKAHDACSNHLLSMTRWESYKIQKKNPGANIRNMLNPERQSLVQNNREYMKTLLEYHRYFCSEEMAYRGHDETDESLNQGKWKEFINVMLRTNPTFEQLHRRVIQTYKAYDYTSKRSSLELIRGMASEVRHLIEEQIDKAGMYSMLIDECKDNASHEELSTCFRFLNDEGRIEERFYDLTRLKETDAQTIVNEGVLPTIEKLASSASLLVLGADGASVMSGCYEGVAAKLRRSYPWLLYIHCAAHRLNLIVAAYFRTVNEASNVINVYKTLHTIFNVASNREIFEAVQKELYPKHPIMAASSLTEVRWACKFEGVNTMVKRLQAILESLQKIGASNSNQADSAAGLYHKILSGKFVISRCFLHQVLSIMHGLSKAMQEVNVKWLNVANEMVAVRKRLVEIETNDIIESAKELCSTVNITLDYEDPVHVSRQDSTKSACPREFCEHLKAASVPMLLEELERRFSSENTDILGALKALDASKPTYLDYTTLSSLVARFGASLHIDSTLLKAECERAKILIADGRNIDPDLYPNLFKVITISKTLPVGTATVGRSFSAMNRILSWARNSLDSSLANDFMLLSMNKDLLKR